MSERLQSVNGDSRALLPALAPRPDAIYLDPMFPPKRRQSAAVKKEMRLLRELVGDDADAPELLEISRRVARDRVVVKRPDDAPPLAPDPSMSLTGKLVRYDVYLAHHRGRNMTEPLFYSEQLAEPGATLVLAGDEAHHAAAARRLHIGDILWLFDGRGGIARATLLRVAPRGRTLELRVEERRTEPAPRPVIHLACALPKGDRQNTMLDMATQLGMTRFTPLDCERSVVKPGANSVARWGKICLEACKQSRRFHLPVIETASTISDVVKRSAADGSEVWLAHPGAQAVTVADAVNRIAKDVTILIGPEGGFTEAEIEQAVAAGAPTAEAGDIHFADRNRGRGVDGGLCNGCGDWRLGRGTTCHRHVDIKWFFCSVAAAFSAAVSGEHFERLRHMQAVTLGIVHAQLAQLLEYLVVFHVLRRGADAHDVADAVDRLDHGEVDLVIDHVAHERAVDLDEIDRAGSSGRRTTTCRCQNHRARNGSPAYAARR